MTPALQQRGASPKAPRRPAAGALCACAEGAVPQFPDVVAGSRGKPAGIRAGGWCGCRGRWGLGRVRPPCRGRWGLGRVRPPGRGRRGLAESVCGAGDGGGCAASVRGSRGMVGAGRGPCAGPGPGLLARIRPACRIGGPPMLPPGPGPQQRWPPVVARTATVAPRCRPQRPCHRNGGPQMLSLPGRDSGRRSSAAPGSHLTTTFTTCTSGPTPRQRAASPNPAKPHDVPPQTPRPPPRASAGPARAPRSPTTSRRRRPDPHPAPARDQPEPGEAPRRPAADAPTPRRASAGPARTRRSPTTSRRRRSKCVRPKGPCAGCPGGTSGVRAGQRTPDKLPKLLARTTSEARRCAGPGPNPPQPWPSDAAQAATVAPRCR